MDKWIKMLWLVLVVILSLGCYMAKAEEVLSKEERSSMLTNIESTVNKIRIEDLSGRAGELEASQILVKTKLGGMDKKIILVSAITVFAIIVLFLSWRSSYRQEKR